MSKKDLLLLSLLVFICYLGLAQFQEHPGYMDADYHFYMGQRLAKGEGFTEEILWNYLDDPEGNPHPSHSYWGPLPSILAALGITLLPFLDCFSAARIPFILLAAATPAIVAWLTYESIAEKRLAFFAAGISALPAFYLPYLLTTDSFSLSIFLGALLAASLIWLERSQDGKISFMIGLLAGLLYLTRSEGLIVMIILLVFMFRILSTENKFRYIILLILGFMLPVLPWVIRNYAVFGTPFPPGAERTLWLLSYDDLFRYPASELSFSNFIASDPWILLKTRWDVFGQNLLSALVVMGSIVLAPLMLLGMWKNRATHLAQLTLATFFLILILMSAVFPFPGLRGGFFHAGAVLQPFLWFFAAHGLKIFLEWGHARRSWQFDRSFHIFSTSIVLIILGLSVFVFSQRVFTSNGTDQNWNSYAEHYQSISALIDQSDEISTVMVNNPPAFANQSGMPAIVIPNGGESMLASAAKSFNSSFVILEENHPVDLNGLYLDPQNSSYFQYLQSIAGSHIFSISPD